VPTASRLGSQSERGRRYCLFGLGAPVGAVGGVVVVVFLMGCVPFACCVDR